MKTITYYIVNDFNGNPDFVVTSEARAKELAKWAGVTYTKVTGPREGVI